MGGKLAGECRVRKDFFQNGVRKNFAGRKGPSLAPHLRANGTPGSGRRRRETPGATRLPTPLFAPDGREAAGDNPPYGQTGFRIVRQRPVLHALPIFEPAGWVAVGEGNGLVEVGVVGFDHAHSLRPFGVLVRINAIIFAINGPGSWGRHGGVRNQSECTAPRIRFRLAQNHGRTVIPRHVVNRRTVRRRVSDRRSFCPAHQVRLL